jgi:glutathione S-transferase
MSKPQLYHYEPNANSMKPLLCLAEKGVPYESHYIDLHNFEQHSAAFVALNPNGQVGVSVERMEKILQNSKWLAADEYSLADVNS